MMPNVRDSRHGLPSRQGRREALSGQEDSIWELIMPAGYKTDFNREGIMMISAETQATTQSVIVSVTERTPPRIGCIELADLTEKVTSAEIKGPDGGSFMVIEKQIDGQLPFIQA